MVSLAIVVNNYQKNYLFAIVWNATMFATPSESLLKLANAFVQHNVQFLCLQVFCEGFLCSLPTKKQMIVAGTLFPVYQRYFESVVYWKSRVLRTSAQNKQLD